MGLEYRCFGEGNEIFVLENGIGRSMYEWYPIAKELAKSGKVVLYHRAGYGKSVCSEKKRTIGQIAEELRELLNQLEIHQHNQAFLQGILHLYCYPPYYR